MKWMVGRRITSFRAAKIEKAGDFKSIFMANVPLPELNPDEVLVKMEYSTINPSDINTAYGRYPIGKPPLVLGLEGSGTVVKSGGSLLSNSLINKTIAFSGQGTWAEYCKIPAKNAFPLISITTKQSASLVINPMTVVMFANKIKENNHKAAIQNPAASALGKMFIKYCRVLGIPLVNLVRRQEQVSWLEKIEAKNIVNTKIEGWKEVAKSLIKEFEVSVGFDAVAGTGTADLSEILKNNSVIYNYGSLSGEDCRISGPALRFRGQKLEGLWVTSWLNEKNDEERVEIGELVQKYYHDAFVTEYNLEIELKDVQTGIQKYVENPATNNKILIKIC